MPPTVTATMVKELRDKTGAGMMDCKAALEETAGDMEAAVDLAAQEGARQGREEGRPRRRRGLIGVMLAPRKGVVVEVNSETDFVARNDLFQGLVKMVAHVALQAGTDVAKIKAAKAGRITVAECLGRHDRKIGENMTLRRAAALSVRRAWSASYVHNSLADGLGKIGVLVALESIRQGGRAYTARPHGGHACGGRKPAGARSRRARSGLVRREKDVLADKYKAQGKPANVIDKIVEFGLKTFYKEVCLLDQAYHPRPEKSVAQAVKEAEGKVGAPIKVTGFVRYAVGEGIEKQEAD